jgi:hypothetical protein
MRRAAYRQPCLISIFLASCLASGGRGMLIFRTPSLKDASISVPPISNGGEPQLGEGRRKAPT